MAIITLIQLKDYLGDKVDEFTDSELNAIISEVNSTIQQELNTDIYRERIQFINRHRNNYINGENTVFYFRNFIDKFLADRDGDGSVTISDVIIYAVDNDSIETLPTITSINSFDVSATLSEAPDSVTMFVDYSYSFYDMDTPDNRIILLAKHLALSLCYFEMELDLIGTSVKMGNQSISGLNTNSKTAKFKKKYEALLSKLLAYGTSKNKPTKFNATKPLNYRPDKRYGYRGYRPSPELGGF